MEKVSEYLMAIMPLFFIEPTVGIMNSYGLVKGHILPLFVACFLSFGVVVVVTGLISQTIIRYQRKREARLKQRKECKSSELMTLEKEKGEK